MNRTIGPFPHSSSCTFDKKIHEFWDSWTLLRARPSIIRACNQDADPATPKWARMTLESIDSELIYRHGYIPGRSSL